MRVREGGRELHTWNDQSLTTHNEDDLHWAKVSHAESAALTNGKSELGNEDGAEEADADCGGDVLCTLKPDERNAAFGCHDCNGVLDHHGHTESDWDQCNHDGQ